MGARIAAHLANAQISSVLLDIVPQELTPQEKSKGLALSDPPVRNRFALAGLDAALKSRPAAFFVPEAARMVTAGNFEDNLALVKDCDWILEAVTEDRGIKRALLEKVQQLRVPGSIGAQTLRAFPLRVSPKASARIFDATGWVHISSTRHAT